MTITARFTISIFIAVATTTLLRSQAARTDSTLNAIQTYYETGAYVNAEVEARRFLERVDLSDSCKAMAEKWIGFSLIAQGKPSLAKVHFSAVLQILPQFELDPLLTSPKILTVFNETKADQSELKKKNNDTLAITAISRQQRITFRTIVFPGWEQIHSGRNTAGYLLLGSGLAALTGGIVCEALRSSARDEYLAATKLNAIKSKYDRYNTIYQAELAFFSAFALVYIGSELDVFLNTDSFSISLLPSQSEKLTAALAISFSF